MRPVTFRSIALVLILGLTVHASSAIIETVAGGTTPLNKTALGTGFQSAIGGSYPGFYGAASWGGETYFAVRDQAAVVKIDSGGVIRLVAGFYGVSGTAGDGGPASVAQLTSPNSVAFDSIGNLYIAESNEVTHAGRIRRVDVFSGFISTYAGGNVSFADGVPATGTLLNDPYGLAFDSADNLYIAEKFSNRVRRVDGQSGEISTLAGNGTFNLGNTNGSPANTQSFSRPRGLICYNGSLYVGILGRIVRVDLSTGLMFYVAGNGSDGSTGDTKPGAQATVNNPASFAFDPVNGGIFFAEDNEYHCGGCNARIRKLNDGYIDPVNVSVYEPHALCIQGNKLIIVDGQARQVRAMDLTTNVLSSIAGASSPFCCDGGLATQAMLANPARLAKAANGHILIADNANSRVRDFDPSTGNITTLAGNGLPNSGNGFAGTGGDGDGGPAVNAALSRVRGVAVDASGNVYIASLDEARIRKVDLTGKISTLAGTGSHFDGPDGVQASTCGVPYPVDVAVNTSTAMLYIAVGYSGVIKKVNLSTGLINTVAGISGNYTTPLVDGNSATSVSLSNSLGGITVDPRNGDLYIADQSNNRVLRVDGSTQAIYRVAGMAVTNTATAFTEGGSALTQSLNYPSDVEVDPNTGDVFISQLSGKDVLRLSGGNLYHVAGSGVQTFVGDGGDPKLAGIISPDGLQVVGSDLYISDQGNDRLRRVGISPLFTPTTTPTITATPSATPDYSPTVSRTQTYTRTPSASPSASPTISASPSTSATPGPACPGGQDVGNSDVAGSTTTENFSGNNGYAMFQYWQAPMAGQASAMRIYLSSVSGLGQVGLYAGTGNSTAAPGALLASSTSFTPVVGWNRVPFTSTVNISNAGNYWFAFQFNTGGSTYIYKSAAINNRAVSNGFGSFPVNGGSAFVFANHSYVAVVELCPPATATVTPTTTPTQTQTLNGTVTSTPFYTSTPVCPGGFSAGNSTIEASPYTAASYYSTQKIVLGSPGRLQFIEVYVGTTGGANLVAAIYDSATGVSPNARLYVSAPQAAVVGWNDIPIGNANLVAGTYFIGIIPSNGSLQTRYNSTTSQGFVQFSAPTYPNFPVTYPSGGFNYLNFSYYAVFCPAGSPTVTPILPTLTNTPSPTLSPTFSISSTTSQTFTTTPTITVTSTISSTLTVSRTITNSPTSSGTSTVTPTPTSTVTQTVTQTWSVTNTFTAQETATVTNTPAPGQASASWITDGTVSALATDGTSVFIGGSFNNVGPRSGPVGGMDLVSKAVLSQPLVENTAGIVQVNAIASDGMGGYYLGGSFNRINGISVLNCAHINALGVVNNYFRPNPDQPVYSLLVDGSLIYVGGAFLNIGGQSRLQFAALNRWTGSVQALPNLLGSAGAGVYALAKAGNTLYLGGSFAYTSSVAHNYLAAVDTVSGLFTNFVATASGGNFTVNALAVSGNSLYVGGGFNTINGSSRIGLGAVDATTGALNNTWNPGCNGYVQTLQLAGSNLYLGGTFTTLAGSPRVGVAAISADTSVAAVLQPNPNLASLTYSSGSAWVQAMTITGNTLYATGNIEFINGISHPTLLAMDITNSSVDFTVPYGIKGERGSAIALEGGRLLLGGQMTSFGMKPRANLAAVDPSTGLPTNWRCDITAASAQGTVSALVVSGTTGRLYVGGQFGTLSGTARSNLGAATLATGASDPGFIANTSSTVDYIRSLWIDGSGLYVGGSFNILGGSSRSGIGEVTSNGTVLGFNPSVNAFAVVHTLAKVASTLYVGGTFTSIGGQPRTQFAALDASGSTGWALALNPAPNGYVFSLLPVGNDLYVGGQFSTFGGGSHNGLARIDIAGNTATSTNFGFATNNYVYALASHGGNLYAAGSLTSVFGNTRGNMATYDLATYGLTTFAPSFDNQINALLPLNGSLHVGGQFTNLNGVLQPKYAAMVPAATVTPVGSPTITPTFSISPTLTNSATITGTSTGTASQTASPTFSNTATPSSSATPTASMTPTGTISPTSTVTDSFTVSPTSTNSPVFTFTSTMTMTPTFSVTQTSSNTPSPSYTFTSTVTPTFSGTFTATPTSSVTQTNTPSSTSTASPSATVTPSFTTTASPSFTATATTSSTSTASPTSTQTSTSTQTPTGPQLTQTSVVLSYTATPVPFLAAPATGPVIVLVPVPVRRGGPLCLASRQPVASTAWLVYNTNGQIVARLNFSNESSQCMATSSLAPGVYYVRITTVFVSGARDASTIRIAVIP